MSTEREEIITKNTKSASTFYLLWITVVTLWVTFIFSIGKIIGKIIAIIHNFLINYLHQPLIIEKFNYIIINYPAAYDAVCVICFLAAIAPIPYNVVFRTNFEHGFRIIVGICIWIGFWMGLGGLGVYMKYFI